MVGIVVGNAVDHEEGLVALGQRLEATENDVIGAVGGVAGRDLEAGDLPVRFVGVGPYSLEVEVFAYINTANYDEFLGLQQELLLRMLQAVEKAGTALAVPLQESFNLHRTQQA